jgi:peptide/nickel transport system permease protein
VRLDFGTSIRTSEPVSTVLARRLGLTLFLGAFAFLIAFVFGVALGTLAALRRRSAADRLIVGTSVAGVSAPPFATGILLLYLFAVLLPWFPAFGAGSGFVDRAYHLSLPAIALAVSGMALIVKITRAAVAEVLDQDYVTFARGRGVKDTTVLHRYVIRNALIPIVTSGGLILGYMLTGAVLVEVTFALPGLGSLLVESIEYKDVPVVQGLAILAATMIVFVNLITDLVYFAIEPRLRVERAAV